jgi:hypothetical protein
MEGRTGVRIRTSTKARKDIMKRRARGFMFCSSAFIPV